MIHTTRLLAFITFLAFFLTLAACTSVPKNKLPLAQRSQVIDNEADIERIMAKAKLEASEDPAVNNIKVLHLKGTPYEMGFQHGRLIQDDVKANVHHIIGLVKWYAVEDIMDEVYDLMAPYIPIEEQEEMRGLAHGADIPLRVIHWLHCIPEVSEFSGKKQFAKGFEGTSCSNVTVFGKAAEDGDIYQLRVLDWIRQLGAQKYPVVLIHQPDAGNASVTFSYAGFIGCVSGMNEKHMGFGEMGYGDPPGESLEGIPFVFLFRKLLREADTLDEARQMIENATRTCSYVYMISDAKAENDADKALLFVADRQRVRFFSENMDLVDERDGATYPAIDDTVYGGAKPEKLYDSIMQFYGDIAVDELKEVAKACALKGNVQNVIFKPRTLEAWVSNAATAGKDKAGRASNQKWFYVDFGTALGK